MGKGPATSSPSCCSCCCSACAICCSIAVLKASKVVLLVHFTFDEVLHSFLLPLFTAVSQRIREGTTCGVHALVLSATFAIFFPREFWRKPFQRNKLGLQGILRISAAWPPWMT